MATSLARHHFQVWFGTSEIHFAELGLWCMVSGSLEPKNECGLLIGSSRRTDHSSTLAENGAL